MAVDLLRQYLQVDTTNPPGNELKAARFYKEILDREGIPAEIDEFAPGRANLLATLKGSGARRALILANHMDVVPADASRWTVPPFSGAVKDGLIYGRGAQDMKTEGILQLVTLIRAKREGLALDRDIYFLATADEEVDFAGALRALSPAGWQDRLRQGGVLHHRRRRERDRGRRQAAVLRHRHRGEGPLLAASHHDAARRATARARWPTPPSTVSCARWSACGCTRRR